MAGLLPDGCYTVSDAMEWAITHLGEVGREMTVTGDWTATKIMNLEQRRQKLMWGFIIHLKLLYFSKRNEAGQLRAALEPFARMAMHYDNGAVMKCAGCDGRPFQADDDQPRPFYAGVSFIHEPSCPVDRAQNALTRK